MADLVDEFMKSVAYWRLAWGLRMILFAPFVTIFVMIVESISDMPSGVFAWILFLYLIGSFTWFVPGWRGLLLYFDEKGLNYGELNRLVQIRRAIWFATLRQAFFVHGGSASH